MRDSEGEKERGGCAWMCLCFVTQFVSVRYEIERERQT